MPTVSIQYCVKVSYQTSIKEINGNTKLNWYRILLKYRFLCRGMVLPKGGGGRQGFAGYYCERSLAHFHKNTRYVEMYKVAWTYSIHQCWPVFFLEIYPNTNPALARS